uniref:DNA-repair protein Xrcc1 N-terminal domain-containing protein n=1 Tax=Leptobrachium leishanense TaxID=445787 RepID=A0A8C5MCL0_9ANUR
MAPIRIQHVVSFSSQDPRHPVENLLNESLIHPWLNCPRDRSRLLKVDLQLERACQIAYIDIGNCGSAFLQIDVGRSTWPSEKSFVTLLPNTTLMNPSDSRLGKERSTVRMFKEGDFLTEAVAERWDRLRVICSQPFNKQAAFGLAFIRLRSPLNQEEQHRGAAAPLQVEASRPLSPSSREPMVNSGGENSRRQEEEKLKEQIHQALSCSSPRVASASPLSRTARMVFSATQARRRCHVSAAPPNPLHLKRKKCIQDPDEKNTGHSTVLTASDSDVQIPPTSSMVQITKPPSRRRLRMDKRSARCRRQTRVQAQRLTLREGDCPTISPSPPDTMQECSSCPICGGYFRMDYLPTHASTCGEAHRPCYISVSSSSDDDSSDPLHSTLPRPSVFAVRCPLL